LIHFVFFKSHGIISLPNYCQVREFSMTANVRVYEPLCRQSAYLSRYTKVTKSTNLRKPAASNGLYTPLYLY